MMRKSFCLMHFLTLLMTVSIYAQTPICGFDLVNKELLKNPDYVQSLKSTENQIRERVAVIEQQRALFQNMNIIEDGSVVEVPVVVHIIRPSNAPAGWVEPTVEQVQSAINRLNNDFKGRDGTRNSGPEIPIRFTLAKRTPSCQATNGVNYINGGDVPGYNDNGVIAPGATGVTGASSDSIKSLSNWPNKSYYNIWVVWKIAASTTPGTYVAGYATLPVNGNQFNVISNLTKEGMVIMGSQLTSSTSTTLTHEMGHAFGLYHTFEGQSGSTCPNNINCETEGDRVCDTDPVINLLGYDVCNISDESANACNNNLQYQGAQRNIMGYGNCLNLLTMGQKTRMIAALDAARAGFKTSVGTLPPPSALVVGATAPSSIKEPGNAYNIGPCNITLGDLHYQSYGYRLDGNAFYLDNSCNMGTVLAASQSHTINVTTQSNAQRCKAWIDFNNNGIFETNELVLNSYISEKEATHSSTISATLLNDATKNTMLRMRVMSDFGSSDFTPETELNYGQTEDFWVSFNTALPVVFDALTAKYSSNQLLVNWSTASEINNDHFYVEASFDGDYFARIAKVNSKAINGTSNQSLNYNISINGSGAVTALATIFLLGLLTTTSLRKNKKWLFMTIILALGVIIGCQKMDTGAVDNNSKGLKYVRIAQVDKDGTTKLSKVVAIEQE